MSTVTLAFLGDVMLGGRVSEAIQSHPPETPWGDVLPLLTKADGVFANLECAITTHAAPWDCTPKVCHFRADPRAVEVLLAGNVRYVSLANNHVLDFGPEGLLHTLDHLDSAGIEHAGAGRTLEEAMWPALVDTNGFKVGVISLTDNEPAFAASPQQAGTYRVQIGDDAKVLDPIEERVAWLRRQGAHLVVLSAHWGPNNVVVPPARFRRFAAAVLERGVDLFHGHSAHVCQGIELRDERLVLYDCGDFLDDYALDPVLRRDWSFVFLVEVDAAGLRRLRMLPVRLGCARVNLASGDEFQAIRRRMQKLSATFGTLLQATEEGLEVPIRTTLAVPRSETSEGRPVSSHVRPAEGVCLFILEDEGVVFSEPAQELYVLNPAATLVWCWLEDGLESGEITAALQQHMQTNRDEARRAMSGIFEQWRQLGLLAGVDAARRRSTRGEDEGARLSLAPQCPPYAEPTVAAERRYRLLTTGLHLRCTSTAQMEWVHPVLAHLETSDPCKANIVVDIIAQEEAHIVYLDGKPVNRFPGLDWLGPAIKSLFWSAAVRNYGHFLYIHAGVVCDGRTCILLPGASGSGKSSLTAALIRSGFHYFSDEVALLEETAFTVPPMPLSLGVKSTGWDALAPLYPELRNLRVHQRCDGKILRYLPPPSAACPPDGGKSYPVGAIIFPRHAPDANTSLVPIGRVEALRRLMEECIQVSAPLTMDNVARLVGWIRGIDCYAMPVSSLARGVELIRTLRAPVATPM